MKTLKTTLATAVGIALGATAGTATADLITASFTGVFTMLQSDGIFVPNPDSGGWLRANGTLNKNKNRTGLTGTMSFDTVTGAGSASFSSFSFFASGLASATSIAFQAVGNGLGTGPGPMILANMGFTWNGSVGIPVSLIMDGSGFFGAAGVLPKSMDPLGTTSLVASDIVTGGATPASNNTEFQSITPSGTTTFTPAIGLVPMATTTFNTVTIGFTLGANPSGTIPMVTDTVVDAGSDLNESGGGDIGVGGSPMPAGPFAGFNANFDITRIHIDTVTPTVVPVPAAVWLFGSGLLGLVGVARRRKSA